MAGQTRGTYRTIKDIPIPPKIDLAYLKSWWPECKIRKPHIGTKEPLKWKVVDIIDGVEKLLIVWANTKSEARAKAKWEWSVDRLSPLVSIKRSE